jgi:hypothetical protein
MMKRAAKTTLIAFLLLILLLSAAFFIVSKVHHRSTHQELVNYINREFGGQVAFQDFSLSYLRHFPRAHIELRGVTILDSGKQVITIDDLDAMLNLWDLWKRQVKVEQLVLAGAVLRSETDSLGNTAALLRSRTDAGDSVHRAMLLEIQRIRIKDSKLFFSNAIKRNRSQISIFQGELKLHSTDSTILLTGDMEGQLDSLISNHSILFSGQPVAGKDVKLMINKVTRTRELLQGTLQAHSLVLTPRLRMEPYQDGNLIELHISGEDKFDEFLGLFQFHFGIDLAQVNPEAKLKLSYNQKGFVNPFLRPYSELDFEITNATFESDDLPFPVDLRILSGNYNNGPGHSPETVELMIDTVRAYVEESFVGGHIHLSNLKDPVIEAHLLASLDMAHVIKASEKLKIEGEIDLDVFIDGKISELRQVHLEGRQHARGKIDIRGLQLELIEQGLALQLVSGSTSLNNHILEITTVVGAFNQSAFQFQGLMENLDRFLLNRSESFTGNFALHFDELDINKWKFGRTKQPKQPSNISLPFATTAINLQITGNRVITDVGDLENIYIDCGLRDDRVTVKELAFDYQEGHVTGSGEMALSDHGIRQVDVIIDGHFDGVALGVRGNALLDSTGLSELMLKGALALDLVNVDEWAARFSSSTKEKRQDTKPSLPGIKDIDLDISIKKILYKDVILSDLHTRLVASNDVIQAENFHLGLPFGKIEGSLSVSSYRKSPMGYAGNVHLSVDSLVVEDLLDMEALGSDSTKVATADADSPEKKGLPDNINIDLELEGRYISYDGIVLENLDVKLGYHDDKIAVERLETGFAGGNLALNGHLERSKGKVQPGYVYLDIRSIGIREVLTSFDDFNQDKFTEENSSGRISSASHHYFTLNEDLTFSGKDNLWLMRTVIHQAEFDRVEPIEKTLFFVGHKSKDTMYVSELDINAVMVGKRIYFTDLVMNDNIANLELAGALDLQEKSLDLAAEISLSDLFFRSRKDRMLETREGTIELDKDAKIFLRLFGPLNDHKLKLLKKKKFQQFREGLMDDITIAENDFREKHAP